MCLSIPHAMVQEIRGTPEEKTKRENKCIKFLPTFGYEGIEEAVPLVCCP